MGKGILQFYKNFNREIQLKKPPPTKAKGHNSLHKNKEKKMNYQELFPKSVIAAINICYDNIRLHLPADLWDEATAMLIQKLKNRAEEEHSLNGSKLLADVQEHLVNEQSSSMYIVVKRLENGNVIHC